LAGREFALVLSSPMRRARETCELAGFADRCEIDDDLKEFDYGDYEGLTTPEIRKHRAGWVWTDGAPRGATAAQVGAPSHRLIKRATLAGGDVLLFAHGH